MVEQHIAQHDSPPLRQLQEIPAVLMQLHLLMETQSYVAVRMLDILHSDQVLLSQ
jgi:hypothetical protein